MTETTIDRALDEWLAEHLFGWNLRQSSLDDRACDCVEPYLNECGHQRYWTDSGDGMLRVLDAMQQREWGALMGTWAAGPGYCCQFYTITNEDGVSALADSMPLAVALAAKAALEASA